MLRTLQSYVSRELLKTFALTAVGLTLTFSLTDGVFNMMRAEGLTAVQALRLMGFILPFALTLTLPLSALFSCAMVYGRLAADNEFDACRASGINIHRLLAPAFGLSVFTCLFSLVFLNYVLPEAIRNLEQLVQKDLQNIIVNALSVRGYIRQGPLAFHTAEPPWSQQRPDGTHVHIGQTTFLQIDGERLSRLGTADQIEVIFWNDEKTGDPVAEASMRNIRSFDVEQKKLFTSAEQPLDPIAVPMSALTDQKTRWLNLSELFAYRRDPSKLSLIQRQLNKLRTQTRQSLLFAYVVQQLTTGDRILRLGEVNGRPKYEIRAERAVNAETDFKPQIDRVTVKEIVDGHDRYWKADRCIANLTRGFGSTPLVVPLHLSGQVTLTMTYPQRKELEKPDTDLEAVPLPEAVQRQEAGISDLDLLGITPEHLRLLAQGELPDAPPPAKFNLGERVENMRISTLNALREQSLQVSREIHSRLAYSASVLVLLVLAAALAIIFRGGQLLTAFVISFLPGLLVFILNIAGRQWAVYPDFHVLGLAVMWSGIGLLGLADVVVLAKFLKR